jgi:hypothetical protein
MFLLNVVGMGLERLPPPVHVAIFPKGAGEEPGLKCSIGCKSSCLVQGPTCRCHCHLFMASHVYHGLDGYGTSQNFPGSSQQSFETGHVEESPLKNQDPINRTLKGLFKGECINGSPSKQPLFKKNFCRNLVAINVFLVTTKHLVAPSPQTLSLVVSNGFQ